MASDASTTVICPVPDHADVVMAGSRGGAMPFNRETEMAKTRATDYGHTWDKRRFLPKVYPPRHCKWCGKRARPPDVNWCGPDCAREFEYRRDPRLACWERDGGVCAVCGLDTADLQDRLRHMEEEERAPILADWGVTNWRSKKLWDADHVLSMSQGGTNDPDNFRTLCLKCHRQETKRVVYHGKKPRKVART